MDISSIFKGTKIVEFASVLAGPSVGMFFAELGAEVVKVENKLTNGDVTRKWKLPKEDENENISTYYLATNWNKESIFLDLSIQKDSVKAYALIKEADILISNYKLKSAIKLNIDYDSVSKINPSIIYGQIESYTHDPDRSGFDALIQAETGWMYMNGDADGNATKLPIAIIDLFAAHQLKEGILVALINKLKTGKGSKVSVSLFDSAIASLANQGSAFLNEGIIPERKGSKHPTIAPYGDILKSKDQVEILLAIGTDHQFKLFIKAFSIDANEYLTNQQRVKHRITLIDIIQKAFDHFESNDILNICKELNIPATRINNLSMAFKGNSYNNDLVLAYSEPYKNKLCFKSTVFRIS